MYIKTLIVLLCFLGCRPSTPTERLVGKWGLDVECTLKAAPDIKNLSHQGMVALARFVGPTFDTFFFNFERDGRMTIKSNQISDEYDYTITAPSTKDSLPLSLSPVKSTSKQDASAQFIGDTLSLKIKTTTYCLVEL
jgi:hypothetical protein